MNKTSNLTLGNVLLDVVVDIIFFPIWWYSFGLIKTTKRLASFVSDREKSLAFFVWLKNIFVPMYGQRDLPGRLISFFMRFFQIIFRGLAILFWIIVSLVLFWLWVALPIVFVYEVCWQLFLK